MSWHVENTGTAEQVIAAIDESVASPHGMPATVGNYLRDAVAACVPSVPALISIRSTGHRPLNAGSVEICEVKVVRSGSQSTTK